MRLRRLDLNLLMSLDALLDTCSVTAAANRLHVTQPSMSGSLARLREHFNDALLVQVGRRMERTPLGDMLLAPVRETLEKIESTISLRPDFDAATASRHFSICASDGTVLALLMEVLKRLEHEAPHVTVDLLPAAPATLGDKLARGELDFIFVVEHAVLASQPQALVIDDDFLCAVWRGNRRTRRGLSRDTYLALGHVNTRYGYERQPGFEQFALERLGVHRRVEVTCPTPTLLGPLVVGTQRVATLPSRLARQQAEALPLRLFEPPFPLPPLRIVMQWNRAREHDGATIWLRDLVLRTARSVPPASPSARES